MQHVRITAYGERTLSEDSYPVTAGVALPVISVMYTRDRKIIFVNTRHNNTILTLWPGEFEEA